MYGTCMAHALGIMRKNLFWGHSVRPGTKKGIQYNERIINIDINDRSAPHTHTLIMYILSDWINFANLPVHFAELKIKSGVVHVSAPI